MPFYFTVRKENEPIEIEVKRSRFICHVAAVSTREEAETYLAQIRAKYRDATHNVFAYFIREGNYSRFSDDGEPSGTAGKPIYDVLKGSGLSDLIVIVTRYFGGTLLGTGGLVHAYGDAARKGLDAANKVKMEEKGLYESRFDYTYYGKISSLLSEWSGKSEKITFDDAVNLRFSVPKENADGFLAALTEATLGKVSAKLLFFEFCAENIN